MYRLLLWTLLLGAGAACTRRPHHMGNGQPQASPATDIGFANFDDNVKIGREAVMARSYATEAACKKAAQRYHKNVLHASGVPVPYQPFPLMYSFPKPGNGGMKPREVRFTVAAVADSSDISFLEVERQATAPTDSTNAQELRATVKMLERAGATTVQQPQIDPTPINGKRAWRAVMRTSKPISSTDKRLTLTGTFGLVINPPYP